MDFKLDKNFHKIVFEQVSKSFPGTSSPIVDNISFGIDRGQFVTILGKSGAGKSSILKLTNRLLEPSTGQILFDGKDIRNSNVYAHRRRIGYVIQAFGLFPHINVAENISISCQLQGWSRHDIDVRVKELLDLVELPSKTFIMRLPHELSGGQKQRVGFARALAAKPEVLLLDEPFAALDSMTRFELQKHLKRLHHELRFTAIMVSHDISEAIFLSDRILVVQNGRIVQAGVPKDLLTSPANVAVAEMTDSLKRAIADYAKYFDSNQLKASVDI